MTSRNKRYQKEPKAVIKTHKLKNMRTKKMEEFPLFTDVAVGLGEGWVTDLAIESRMDDDVDTDEDIYEGA